MQILGDSNISFGGSEKSMDGSPLKALKSPGSCSSKMGIETRLDLQKKFFKVIREKNVGMMENML